MKLALPQEGALAANGVERLAADRRVHHANGQAVLVLERDAHRPGREAVEEVPIRLPAVLTAPLHQLDVVESGRPFAHQLQDVVAQALDPWLDKANAGVAKLAHLAAGEVRLALPEKLDIQTSLSKHGKHRVEIAHVKDVVHNAKCRNAIALAQESHLRKRTLGRLAAERHRGAVESTERAV